MIDWLAAPIDPARAHDLGGLVSWHARLMVLAWAIFVPMGVIAARYFKVLPGQDWPRELDNRLWWVAHRGFQYAAGLAMVAAMGLVLIRSGQLASLTPAFWLHSAAGLGVLGLALIQYSSAWLRGSKGGPTSPAPDGSLHGDHFDMTRRRLWFEHIHKFGGMLALLLAVGAILTGLWQANAPNWMWLTLTLWWAGLIAGILVLERRFGAFDTYQAIWGPDPGLPGNRRGPIGVRVRRSGRSRSPR